MLRNVSAWHVLIVLVVILLLFGANRLPGLAKSVGQSMKIFKNEVKDLADDGKRNDSYVAPDPVTGATAEHGTDVPPPATPPAAPRP